MTTPTNILDLLRLAVTQRTRSLAGLALQVLPRDRDLDRVGDELLFAAQDEVRSSAPEPAPATAPSSTHQPAPQIANTCEV